MLNTLPIVIPSGTDDEVLIGFGTKGSQTLQLSSSTAGKLRTVYHGTKPIQSLTMLADGRGAVFVDSRVTGSDPLDLRYVALADGAVTLLGEKLAEGYHAVDPDACAVAFSTSKGANDPRTWLQALPR